MDVPHVRSASTRHLLAASCAAHALHFRPLCPPPLPVCPLACVPRDTQATTLAAASAKEASTRTRWARHHAPIALQIRTPCLRVPSARVSVSAMPATTAVIKAHRPVRRVMRASTSRYQVRQHVMTVRQANTVVEPPRSPRQMPAAAVAGTPIRHWKEHHPLKHARRALTARYQALAVMKNPTANGHVLLALRESRARAQIVPLTLSRTRMATQLVSHAPTIHGVQRAAANVSATRDTHGKEMRVSPALSAPTKTSQAMVAVSLAVRAPIP